MWYIFLFLTKELPIDQLVIKHYTCLILVWHSVEYFLNFMQIYEKLKDNLC